MNDNIVASNVPTNTAKCVNKCTEFKNKLKFNEVTLDHIIHCFNGVEGIDESLNADLRYTMMGKSITVAFKNYQYEINSCHLKKLDKFFSENFDEPVCIIIKTSHNENKEPVLTLRFSQNQGYFKTYE